MVQLLSTVFVLVGMAILGWSIVLDRRLIATLPAGRLRNRWRAMTALVAIFVVGYATYLALFVPGLTDITGMVVPLVFLLGAGYVWVTAKLALTTTEGVRRIAELEQETVTDPLTGLFNRRYLDRRIEEEVARAERYGTPLSVVLLDLDHFKNINDSYGHDAGDQVLRRFAKTIRGALRESDFVARFGGEEFLVVAPHTGLADAEILAERLRVRVAEERFRLPAEYDTADPIVMTVSIGVAGRDDQQTLATEIVRAADNCLYRAKRLGRNRVVVAGTRSGMAVDGRLQAVPAA